jgi:hypothetical protein
VIALNFKIEHADWTAELCLVATHTLADLAAAIITAVGFDFDHSFGFYDNLKNPYRSKEEYTLFADLGEAGKEGDTGVQSTLVSSVFRPRKKMIFLFDYGDDWMFLVTCTGEVETRAFKRPKILSTSGEPPQQYPDYDD